MKFTRLLLIILGLVVLVCGVGAGLALTPGIQRRVLLRAVGTTPGLKLSVGEFAAGLSHLRLRNVVGSKDGLGVTLERLDADYSLLRLVFNRRLHITRLAASGLVVDASRLSPATTEAAAAGAPAVAPGLLAQLELPVQLVLEETDIVGRVLLAGTPGQPARETEFKISGGKFAPGVEGTLHLTTRLRNPVPDARVTALNAQISLQATQTDRKTFSRVGLTAVVDAEGKTFSGQNQLKVSAELLRDATGEKYSCHIDTLLQEVAERMLTFNATLPAGQPEYGGQWTLKARAAQLEPFLLGGILPDFTAHGEGRFALNPSTRAGSLSGGLEAEVSRLEVIEPAWRPIGTVKMQTRFDVALAQGLARLHQLEVRLTGDRPVLDLTASQAAVFNLKEGRLQMGGTAPGEVLNLNISGLPLAWVRPFVHELDVSGGMITGRFSVSNGEDRLRVRTVAPLQVDALSMVQRGQLLLAKAAISLDAEAVLTAGEIQASITAFTLKTPAGDSFTARAGVTLPTTPNPPVTITAGYTAELPKLLEPWLPIGRVQASGEADLTLKGGTIEVRRLTTSVADAAGLNLFQADALRPFALDLVGRRAATIASAGSGNDLLQIKLGRIPLDRLPLNQPGAQLDGEVEQGEFVLSMEGDKLVVRSASPLKLAHVSLTQGGRPALTGLGIEAAPTIEVTGRTAATIRSGEVTVRTAEGATLLTFKGEAVRAGGTGLQGNLAFNLEVPALATQPLFAGAQAVTQGRANGEIRAVLGTPAGQGAGGLVTQVEARLTTNGLVARDGGQTLPVANLSFRAIAQANGRLSVQAPLLLDRAGQRSDLNFSLELTPAKGGYGIDGKLTGEQVELADAMSLLGVFLATSAPEEVAPAQTGAKAPVPADTGPAWARFNGRLILDVKSVTRGTEWTMTGLTGLVAIEPTRISLERLEAAFGEKSRFTAQGEVGFRRAPAPYRLNGDFSLTEFDAGKLFKALEPGKPATVEGIFSVAGHLEGTGGTLDQTLEHTRGRFDLVSRQGVFRGLQRASGKVSMTSKAVELGASVLGSLFGSQKVTKAAEKVAGTAYFVDQLAQSVGEFNYDQLNVRLTRDEALNMKLEDISLVSPEIRLLGQGAVTHVADKPLLDQPLSVSLVFAGRGKIEQLLGKLRLLDGTRDDLGYAKTSQPVIIGGTLARPDPSAFFTRIATAKLTDLLAPEE